MLMSKLKFDSFFFYFLSLFFIYLEPEIVTNISPYSCSVLQHDEGREASTRAQHLKFLWCLGEFRNKGKAIS